MEDDNNENTNQVGDFLQNGIVVDDDVTACQSAKKCLLAMGMKNVVVFTDSEKAWEELTKDDQQFDLIVLDWRIPELSGAAIFNRLRQSIKYQNTPIVVISGYLEKADFRLLEEFPFTNYLSKPFAPILMESKLRILIDEYQWFQQKKGLLEDVFNALANDGPKALEPIKTLLTSAPKPIPLTLAAARMLIRNECFDEAEEILRDLLDKIPECLLAMNELAKIYFRRKSYPKARKILEKAQELSPTNLERLCLLGNANLNMMEIDEAQKCFNKANSIDKDDKTMVAGKTLVNNVNDFLKQANVVSIPSSFASLLNSIGISHVKNGQFDKGIDLYKSALLYVADTDSKAKLAFNLGLGYLRWEKPDDALPWFVNSTEISKGSYTKAKKHADKLRTKTSPSSGKEFRPPRFERIEENRSKSKTLADLEMETSINEDKIEDEIIMDEEIVGKDKKQQGFDTSVSMDEDIIDEKFLNPKVQDQGKKIPFLPDPQESTQQTSSGKFNEEDNEYLDHIEKIIKPDPIKTIRQISEEEPKGNLTPKDLFYKMVPEADSAIKMLFKTNEHVDSNITQYLKLLNVHGLEDFRAGLMLALKNGTPSANRVSFYLKEIEKKKPPEKKDKKAG